jgi:lysozyme
MASNKVRVAAASISISAAALIGIAVSEGYVGQTYKDIGGVLTIGFGETGGVKEGQRTDPVRALIKLNESAAAHARGMVACITVPLSQGEYDAYLSFTYNLGIGSFCRYIAPVLNKLDYDAACKKILLFDHVGTQKVPGLTRRRQEEYATCQS